MSSSLTRLRSTLITSPSQLNPSASRSFSSSNKPSLPTSPSASALRNLIASITTTLTPHLEQTQTTLTTQSQIAKHNLLTYLASHLSSSDDTTRKIFTDRLNVVTKVEYDRSINEQRVISRGSIGEQIAKIELLEIENKRLLDVTVEKEVGYVSDIEDAVKRAEAEIVARLQSSTPAIITEEEEEEEEPKTEMKLEEIATNSTPPHPILGHPLLTLPFKKFYLLSSATLTSFPVWSKQRTYSHSRAMIIANHKLYYNGSLKIGLPGVITLLDDGVDGISILDGQHRVGMMAILNHQKKVGSLDGGVDLGFIEDVVVEVYESGVLGVGGGERLFREINRAEPVKGIDLVGDGYDYDEEEEGEEDEEEKEDVESVGGGEGEENVEEAEDISKASTIPIITSAVTLLSTHTPLYKLCFKPTSRCLVPHVNVDGLRDLLFSSNYVQRNGISNEGELLKALLSANSNMKAKYDEAEAEGKGMGRKGLAKAKKCEFYLGMDESWVYE